jgi:seryl-tRNA synthetase
MLKNNVEHGYTPVTPPLMANKESLLRNGSLPKFEGDFYSVEQENLSLIPTAEVALTSLHANKTYSADELPKRNTAWTSCFRREAGGYGATERGLIRVHQFEKVEIYSVTTPEESEKELEKIVQTAEGLLQKLEIPYRISLLAAKDTSFVSSKTFDLEVWLPGQDSFYEISSCSNCTDFQARRAKIRVKTTEEKKSRFAHTLNGSSLSIPRLIVALMENYQQQDGSIKLPNVLQKEIDSLW